MTEGIVDGGREGHFGIEGMRERAGRIGGRLSISSKASTGTEVRLTVPPALAYRAPGKLGLCWPGWLKFGGSRGAR